MAEPTRRSSLLRALALCALVIAFVARASRPPSPVSATAPDTDFSAERAMRHVRADRAAAAPDGHADHERVRDYIVAQLTALGMPSQVQETTAIGTRYQEGGRVQN